MVEPLETIIRKAYNYLKKELHLTDNEMYKKFPDLCKEAWEEESVVFKHRSDLEARSLIFQLTKEK